MSTINHNLIEKKLLDKYKDNKYVVLYVLSIYKQLDFKPCEIAKELNKKRL